MDTEWISKRPYLASVVARMNELLEHADALIESARGSGESVDYGAFEEEVAMRTAQVEAERAIGTGSSPRRRES